MTMLFAYSNFPIRQYSIFVKKRCSCKKKLTQHGIFLLKRLSLPCLLFLNTRSYFFGERLRLFNIVFELSSSSTVYHFAQGTSQKKFFRPQPKALDPNRKQSYFRKGAAYVKGLHVEWKFIFIGYSCISLGEFVFFFKIPPILQRIPYSFDKKDHYTRTKTPAWKLKLCLNVWGKIPPFSNRFLKEIFQIIINMHSKNAIIPKKKLSLCVFFSTVQSFKGNAGRRATLSVRNIASFEKYHWDVPTGFRLFFLFHFCRNLFWQMPHISEN